jgi:hypothetical protein
MAKKLIFAYTQIELDTDTGATRIMKHWQKIQSQEPRAKKRTLESETPTEEFME